MRCDWSCTVSMAFFWPDAKIACAVGGPIRREEFRGLTRGGVIIQHFLALCLIVIGPIWDQFEIRKLKTSTDPRRKLKFYWLTIGWTWTLSAIACATVGWPQIFGMHADPRDIGWIPSGNGARLFMVGVLVAFIAGVMVPVLLARR